ncbi:MAG: hypothetical protein ACYDBP_08555 [Leptospirales bacterium]
MSRIVPCYRCGKGVAPDALRCPGCGTKNPGRSWFYRRGPILAGLALIMAGIFMVAEHSETLRHFFNVGR